MQGECPLLHHHFKGYGGRMKPGATEMADMDELYDDEEYGDEDDYGSQGHP